MVRPRSVTAVLKFRRLKVTTVSLVAFLVSNFCFVCPPATAAEAAAGQAIVDLIRHANIVPSDYKLTASVSDEEALVTTQRKPKATDADCKILSALIAKTAFEAIPENIQRVKVVLLDYDADASSSVVVNRAVIKLFGSGGLSEKELLGSLALTTSGGSSSKSSEDSSVQSGPQEVDRMLLLGRIEKLKSKGTNVSAFMNFFNQIEGAAKSGDEAGVASKVSYLREKLTDQEQLVKQAQATSNVRSNAKSSSGMGSGRGSSPAGFEEMARRYTEGSLDPGMLQMAMRVANVQQRMMLNPSIKNANFVNGQLQLINSLMAAGRTKEANDTMTNLEAKMDH